MQLFILEIDKFLTEPARQLRTAGAEVSPQAIHHSVCDFITSPRSPPGHRLAITEPVPVKFPDGLSRLGVGRSRAAGAAVEQTLCSVASSSAPNHINPMLREHLASGTGDLFS